jgi:hypothetical protein
MTSPAVASYAAKNDYSRLSRKQSPESSSPGKPLHILLIRNHPVVAVRGRKGAKNEGAKHF